MPSDSNSSTTNEQKFLTTISHEIRTPLNAISGMSQLLADTKLDQTQQEFVAIIQKAGSHVLSLVDNLLDVTLLQANELVLESNVLDVFDEISALSCSLNNMALEKEIPISVECTPDVRGNKVLDKRRFNQCVSNLLRNAIKFTNSGKINLSCWVEPNSQTGGTLYVSVTDSGPGIVQKDMEKIFAPFQQSDEATKRAFDGAGLGLSVTRDLARVMGGDVEVTSAPGCGSTFTLSVEFAAQEPKTEKEPFGHILIVEDHQTNQRLIQLVLEKLGHSCDVAADGKQGVQMFEAKEYDLVLMDLHMPVMNGFEATAAIRASGRANCDLPIIALTADVRPGIEQRITDAGMDAYISKPFEVPTLATIIATCLAMTLADWQDQRKQA